MITSVSPDDFIEAASLYSMLLKYEMSISLFRTHANFNAKEVGKLVSVREYILLNRLMWSLQWTDEHNRRSGGGGDKGGSHGQF